MFENLNKFFVRYVKIARNGYLYEKYERDIRRKMLNLKYDLAELEEFYKAKEKEKRTQLLASIEELQKKNDNLQKEYEEEKEKCDKDFEYTLECKQRKYQLISNQLVIDIQDLSAEKAALEVSIEKIQRDLPKEVAKELKKEKQMKKMEFWAVCIKRFFKAF